MADDRVRVYARIRPQGTSREEFGDAAVRCVGENGVSVDDLEGAVNDSLRNSVQGGVAQAAASTRKFDFDGSFGGSSTQADVFSDVGAPVVGRFSRATTVVYLPTARPVPARPFHYSTPELPVTTSRTLDCYLDW